MATINYDDERFAEVESDKQQALTENEQLYNGMINQSDQYYKDQMDALTEWGDKQQQIQQDQTDFAIEKVEQQKEQAKKDYLKEQSGSYVDWQKASGQYGANAEQMAASGLTGTGYSESSKVGMWNTYQNRVATARESYNNAVLDYNNAIKEAQLQNSSVLAEIAYNTLQQRLQLALEGFQYKNTLLLEQANKKQELDNTYYSRYQDVVDQINTENALEEQKRQYDEQMAYQKAQDERNYQLQLQQLAEEKRQYNESLAFQKAQAAKSSSGGSGGSSSESSMLNQNEVSTAYYQGALNSDANKYGTFDNGYQPKGITGHGTLSKSKKKNGKVEQITIETQTLSGQKQTVTQNVWKAEDGTKWYWEGRQNKYIQIG